MRTPKGTAPFGENSQRNILLVVGLNIEDMVRGEGCAVEIVGEFSRDAVDPALLAENAAGDR